MRKVQLEASPADTQEDRPYSFRAEILVSWISAIGQL